MTYTQISNLLSKNKFLIIKCVSERDFFNTSFDVNRQKCLNYEKLMRIMKGEKQQLISSAASENHLTPIDFKMTFHFAGNTSFLFKTFINTEHTRQGRISEYPSSNEK